MSEAVSPNRIADEWQTFKEACFGHTILDPIQEQELRRAFFGGVAAMYQIAIGPDVTANDEAHGMAVLESLHNELIKFAEDVEVGKA